jgi:hypothetical protein
MVILIKAAFDHAFMVHGYSCTRVPGTAVHVVLRTMVDEYIYHACHGYNHGPWHAAWCGPSAGFRIRERSLTCMVYRLYIIAPEEGDFGQDLKRDISKKHNKFKFSYCRRFREISAFVARIVVLY